MLEPSAHISSRDSTSLAGAERGGRPVDRKQRGCGQGSRIMLAKEIWILVADAASARVLRADRGGTPPRVPADARAPGGSSETKHLVSDRPGRSFEFGHTGARHAMEPVTVERAEQRASCTSRRTDVLPWPRFDSLSSSRRSTIDIRNQATERSRLIPAALPGRPRSEPGPAEDLWTAPLDRWLRELAASPAGLSGKEAAQRLERYGPNDAMARRQRPLLLQFLARFGNPLVLILLVASAVSAFTGDVTNFLIITAIVLLSVTLDFVQEVSGQGGSRRCASRLPLRADRVRDGIRPRTPGGEAGARRCRALGAGDSCPPTAGCWKRTTSSSSSRC